MTYNCKNNTPPTSQCANNQPITGPVTHYNDVSITFTSKTAKQNHASFFSKLVKQTIHSMLIFV